MNRRQQEQDEMDIREGWMGDVYRRPQTQQELREAALRAMSPEPAEGTLEWIEHHLSRVTYKPGWAWRVHSDISQRMACDFTLAIRIEDPNRRYWRQFRRLPAMVSPVSSLAEGLGTVTPTLETLALRSAVVPPSRDPVDSKLGFTAGIPEYAYAGTGFGHRETVDALIHWFQAQLRAAEYSLVQSWLAYRGRLVEPPTQPPPAGRHP